MSDRLASALAEVDDAFVRFHATRVAPGVAWGVVAGGGLIHAAGLGTLRDGEDRPPDADSVFRIASITKSFTAATVMLLRDEGRLRLDDPVALHVPELSGWKGPTADSPPVTIRHLLTMSGGLATDDPWGDRQQGLALERFAELLLAGPSFAWPPGTTFEYSNLGYGILGRVVSNAAGREYREVVEERFLAPLGMTATTLLVEDVTDERLARGYVRRDDAFWLEPFDGYGALAVMGGILTSVRDLARWVAFLADAFPARDDPDDGPLSRASRREMQQVQRAIAPIIRATSAAAEPSTAGGGYGFGLFVAQRARIGTTVGHPGGYPGFGSHMRWHPATGLGVVALANGRYATPRPTVDEALDVLVDGAGEPRRRVVAAPATLALRAVAEQLVECWDDDHADRVFAMNMDLDEPRDRRRAELARIREIHGALLHDESEEPASESPADVTWWLRGERGRVRVSILVTPEAEPRLQRLDLESVPDPSPALTALAERVLAVAAEPDPTWPSDLARGAGLERAVLEREFRAAAARFGSMALGRPVAGDGRTSATWALETERGQAELRLGLDPETGAVAAAAIVPRDIVVPPEAW